MLRAHSLLWHYLWVAPNILLVILTALIWRRGPGRQIRVFCVFAVLTAACHLTLYTADVTPSVSGPTFWRIDWAGLLVETLLKFALIGEVFSQVFEPYPSVSRLGKLLVRGLGATLVLVAALAAAFAHSDSTVFLISGAHLLEQTSFIIESGIILFLFLFAAYFHLQWNRISFGILLGLGISACVHLATWAVSANVALPAAARVILDFLDMTTYHVCVLIWFYYLLVPKRSVDPPQLPPAGGGSHDEDVAVWNRELERLIHQ